MFVDKTVSSKSSSKHKIIHFIKKAQINRKISSCTAASSDQKARTLIDITTPIVSNYPKNNKSLTHYSHTKKIRKTSTPTSTASFILKGPRVKNL